MSSFNNLFRNLNLSKKSQLSPIFRTGGSSMLNIYKELLDSEYRVKGVGPKSRK